MILFVTGTDTGVGKTVVSAWLCARERDAGATVRYCKPIQTGDEDDAAFVADVAGVEVHRLVHLRDPLAPSVAAAREGRSIDVEELVARTRALEEGVDVLIVEGAGGLLVPITDEVTMADFAGRLGARLVVVARPGLGTLNHIALTLEAAQRRGLSLHSLILSGVPAEPDLAMTTNIELLRARGLPLRMVPVLDDPSIVSS